MPIWGVLAAFALVAANAFFVAVEFATTRARPTQVNAWLEAGTVGSRSAKHAVDHIDNYLSACQLGITFASIGLGVVGEPAFAELLKPVFGETASIAGVALGGLIAYLLITMLHVVLGELSPKSLAIARTERTLLLLAPPMRIFYLATRPLVDFLNFLGNLVLKPFGVPPASESGHQPHSEDELRRLLEESAREGLIEEQEASISQRSLLYGDRRAREVMRPRAAIDHLAADLPVTEAARRAEQSGHNRLPIVDPEAGLDRPVGVVHVKDLLHALVRGDEETVADLARPLPRVAESTLIDEVLRGLRRDRLQMALVVDEHGTVTGLLTLEDIIEEIVGEIEDEFDPPGQEQLRRVDGGLRVDGEAPTRLVAGELGLDLGHHREATIGGHVVEVLGRVPDEGEEITVHGRRVQVLEVDPERARVRALCFPDADGEG